MRPQAEQQVLSSQSAPTPKSAPSNESAAASATTSRGQSRGTKAGHSQRPKGANAHGRCAKASLPEQRGAQGCRHCAGRPAHCLKATSQSTACSNELDSAGNPGANTWASVPEFARHPNAFKVTHEETDGPRQGPRCISKELHLRHGVIPEESLVLQVATKQLWGGESGGNKAPGDPGSE